MGAFFGCSGDGGFNGCCSGACSGDGGFMLACISGCRGVNGCIVATWLCPVREKVRPACSKWPEIGVLWRAGRSFSRASSRGDPLLGELFRGNAAGGPLPGEVFRGPAVEGSRWTRARHLDGGCVPPLDLGRATDTRSRMHLPSWLPVGASGRRPAIAFPQDSSHFAENATHPYI